MAPRLRSRYSYTQAIPQADSSLQLSDYEPFRYVPLDDNLEYTVCSGDTYFNLAAQFYGALQPRPSGLWWILCDFQPAPVIDPTVPPAVGSTLWVPSVRTVREKIFDESRRPVTVG